MLTKEFVNKVKELGYEIEFENDFSPIIRISNGIGSLGTVFCDTNLICNYSFTPIELKKIMREYEDTPIDEREEKNITLFEIPLFGLKTIDGYQQYLSYDEEKDCYFVSRGRSTLKQTFTEDELEKIPSYYRVLAKEIKDVNN
ncbi:hypothetical protein AXE85_05735 [Gemella sp. oral taxon 928]|uniref:hypothetical protein n=1 Tax=Gemella sp. oral taxon 928 TaxID=1785995 RepID=UPI0007684E14|nr:hypothetical protein [Gemella sp. oral taxon 928]AME09687.1 hypothetical protein AXE85_05735 [Gemella sp. oral taxon 928]